MRSEEKRARLHLDFQRSDLKALRTAARQVSIKDLLEQLKIVPMDQGVDCELEMEEGIDKDEDVDEDDEIDDQDSKDGDREMGRQQRPMTRMGMRKAREDAEDKDAGDGPSDARPATKRARVMRRQEGGRDMEQDNKAPAHPTPSESEEGQLCHEVAGGEFGCTLPAGHCGLHNHMALPLGPRSRRKAD